MSRRCVGGDEQDAFTGWRRVVSWKRNELRRIKTAANRRERREAKREIRDA